MSVLGSFNHNNALYEVLKLGTGRSDL